MVRKPLRLGDLKLMPEQQLQERWADALAEVNAWESRLKGSDKLTDRAEDLKRRAKHEVGPRLCPTLESKQKALNFEGFLSRSATF